MKAGKFWISHIMIAVIIMGLILAVAPAAAEVEYHEVIAFEDAYMIDEFNEGLACMMQIHETVKFGYIDGAGNTIIPVIYDRANSFSDGMACVGVWKNGALNFGYIDKSGNIAVPIQYHTALSFREDMAVVEIDKKYGAIDKLGNIVVPLKYDSSDSYFSEGMLGVKTDNKWGYVGKSGDIAVPPKYDEASSYSEGFAAVAVGEKWGFIDKAGNEVIPIKYDGVKRFSEGMAAVGIKTNDGDDLIWGFVDTIGHEAIPLIYSEYEPDWSRDGFYPSVQYRSDNDLIYSEGKAAVKQNGKWGFIDKNGELIVAHIFDEAAGFKEGVARVKNDEGWGYIDDKGEVIVPCEYYGAMDFSEGFAAVETFGKWGYIDKTGKTIIPPKYDSASGCSEGYAVVRQGEVYSFIDLQKDRPGESAEHGSGPISTPTAAGSADEIKVIVNGKTLAFDVPPQLINDRVLVPVRKIFEEIGAEVEWDDKTNTVTSNKDGTIVVLVIGDSYPTINGRTVAIDQPAVVVEGRTLAPVRFVAEAFGGKVEWADAENTVYIDILTY